MPSKDLKIFGSTEATLIIGFIVMIFGVLLIVYSGKKLIWPISGLMPV